MWQRYQWLDVSMPKFFLMPYVNFIYTHTYMICNGLHIYIFTYTMTVNCSILYFEGVEIAELRGCMTCLRSNNIVCSRSGS